MKNKQMIKLFILLLFSTTFIFSFSLYGAHALGTFTNAGGKFSEGTYIGYLDLSGKTESEASSLLEEKYIDWLKNTKVSFEYQEKSAPFDLNLLHLDAQQTMNSIKDGQKNKVFITIDKEKVGEQIQILFPQLKSEDFDLNKLTIALTQTSSNFEIGTYTLNLYHDYLLADKMKKDAVINTTNIQVTEIPEDLQSILDENLTIEIPSQASFSLLDYVKEKKLKLQPDSLNEIATGIYQTILPTNIGIVERNIGSVLPEYAKLGYEAKVSVDKNMDLVISNPNKGKYVLKIMLENSHLKFLLQGENLLYTYKVTVTDVQKLPPKTIIQYSPLLLPGKAIIQSNGADGQIVTVYREVYQGYQLMNKELVSEDYYPPAYRVEIHALAGNATTAAQPTGTQSGSSTQTTTNTTNSTSQVNNQTTNEATMPVSNQSNLWGTPNEQPK